MPTPNPIVRLEVQLDEGSRQRVAGQVGALKKEVESLSRRRGAGDPETQKAKDMLRLAQSIAGAQDKATQAARGYGNALRNVEGVMRNLNIMGGSGGAAGDSIMAIGGAVGKGGLAAIGVAVAAAAGMAMKMGLEFERVSVRAAQQLSIGSATFADNIGSIKRAAQSAGQPYGIGMREMAGAIAGYGVSSGATVSAAAREAPAIARYSRAYGMEPTSLATMIGAMTASTQEGFERAAQRVFGQAETAGPMGRRIGEFIGAATSMLTSLQMQNPGRNWSSQQASAMTSNIAGLGGIYGTAPGVAAFSAASGGLMSGTHSDLQKMAFAVRAGITNPLDLILERGTPDNQRKMLQYALKIAHGDRNMFAATLVGLTGSPDAARNIYGGVIDRAGGNLSRIYDLSKHPMPPVGQRVATYLSTPLAQVERSAAGMENIMTHVGDDMLYLAKGPLKVFADGLDHANQYLLSFGAPGKTSYYDNMRAGGGVMAGYLDPMHQRKGEVLGPGTFWDMSGGRFGPSMLSEYRNSYDPASHTGISTRLAASINAMTSMGWKLGIYDMNDAAHKNLGDIHRLGRAMDIDSIVEPGQRSVHALGGFSQADRDAAMAALSVGGRIGVNSYKLIDWLKGQGYGSDRVFHDGPGHMHVEVGPDDPRWSSTVSATGRDKHGHKVSVQVHVSDDLGHHGPLAGPRSSNRAASASARRP